MLVQQHLSYSRLTLASLEVVSAILSDAFRPISHNIKPIRWARPNNPADLWTSVPTRAITAAVIDDITSAVTGPDVVADLRVVLNDEESFPVHPVRKCES